VHRKRAARGGSEEIVTTAAGRAPKAKKTKRRAPHGGSADPVVSAPRRGGNRPDARESGGPTNGIHVIRSSPRRVDSVDRLWSSYRRSPTDTSRNRLVEAYQGLVREVVRRFAYRLPRSVERGDLDTAANFGLISAIEGFDPSRGVRFESYCELRVKGALLDELRNQDWLPRPWRTRIEPAQARHRERLRAEQNREPSDEDVAAGMDLPLAEYCQLFGVGLPAPPSARCPPTNPARKPPPASRSSRTSTATPPANV
jgi:RNA polymerase sigma factor (sigma-70 family)